MDKNDAKKAKTVLKVMGAALGLVVGFIVLTTLAKIILIDVLGWF